MFSSSTAAAAAAGLSATLGWVATFSCFSFSFCSALSLLLSSLIFKMKLHINIEIIPIFYGYIFWLKTRNFSLLFNNQFSIYLFWYILDFVESSVGLPCKWLAKIFSLFWSMASLLLVVANLTAFEVRPREFFNKVSIVIFFVVAKNRFLFHFKFFCFYFKLITFLCVLNESLKLKYLWVGIFFREP